MPAPLPLNAADQERIASFGAKLHVSFFQGREREEEDAPGYRRTHLKVEPGFPISWDGIIEIDGPNIHMIEGYGLFPQGAARFLWLLSKRGAPDRVALLASNGLRATYGSLDAERAAHEALPGLMSQPVREVTINELLHLGASVLGH